MQYYILVCMPIYVSRQVSKHVRTPSHSTHTHKALAFEFFFSYLCIVSSVYIPFAPYHMETAR